MKKVLLIGAIVLSLAFKGGSKFNIDNIVVICSDDKKQLVTIRGKMLCDSTWMYTVETLPTIKSREVFFYKNGQKKAVVTTYSEPIKFDVNEDEIICNLVDFN